MAARALQVLLDPQLIVLAGAAASRPEVFAGVRAWTRRTAGGTGCRARVSALGERGDRGRG